MLFRDHAEGACQAATVFESGGIAYRGDQGGRAQKADARDGAQRRASGQALGELFELALDLFDVGFELADFRGGLKQSGMKGLGDWSLWISQSESEPGQDESGA